MGAVSLFPAVELGSNGAALRVVGLDVGRRARGLGSAARTSSLGLVARAPTRPALTLVCAICGEECEAQVSFCTGCGSWERAQAPEQQVGDARGRLHSRVEQSLAAEAALHVSADGDGDARTRALQTRTAYAQLGSQRRLLRDRVLQARDPQERAHYRDLLGQVEHALGQAATRQPVGAR